MCMRAAAQLHALFVCTPQPSPARVPPARRRAGGSGGGVWALVSCAETERPHTILALSVEPNKPRLIVDARPINLSMVAMRRSRPCLLRRGARAPMRPLAPAWGGALALVGRALTPLTAAARLAMLLCAEAEGA